MSPVSVVHMRLSNFLHLLLLHFLAQNPLGELLSAPFALRISPQYVLEPDLMFVCNEHTHRIQNTGMEGAADVVIEITSPESDDRDRNKKFRAYQAGGVSEYWLLEPLSSSASFYRLDQDNQYQLVTLDEQGYFRSVVLTGFALPVKVLWSVAGLTATQMVKLVETVLES